MKKNLSTNSVHNRADRRRNLQPNKADTGVRGPLADFQPATEARHAAKGVTLGVVGLVLAALVIAFLFDEGAL